MVGWMDSDRFDDHSNGGEHLERPARLQAVREALGQSLESRLERVAAEAVDRELLEEVHRPSYVSTVEKLSDEGGGPLDGDTRVGAGSWGAALRAAGAVVEATERVLAGTWQAAFCSVRPPGHHARPGIGMGFCLFDNVAVAAQAALRHPEVERVAILDWDVHHGNGTQEIFYRRSDVLFASWHQFPFYPGTGSLEEVGEGPGEGFTVNCPLPRGAGDRDYLEAWRERVRPALEEYRPDLVLVSAGFDADARDPLGGHELTASGYQDLSAEVVAFAREACRGRVVSVLEGGYDLEALGENACLHVETLLG